MACWNRIPGSCRNFPDREKAEKTLSLTEAESEHRRIISNIENFTYKNSEQTIDALHEIV